MGILKKIAQDPDEGPDQTKDCTVCTGNGPSPGMLWGVNPSPERPPFPCGNCNGTGKVHK